MTKWKIYNEDAVKWAKNYQKAKFHALLCDAPYHLTSIVKRFGKAKISDNTKTSEKVRNRSDGYSRLVGTGFMGQTWDGGDLAFRPETWEAFGEVLHPGAFGMAFSASRNWHRMAVAIEDAGFVIHPTMFILWAFGSGFPKATRVHKQGEGDFDSHRYGLQAMKPAVEPIIVFQKRFEGKPRDNIVETGAGTINIDGGRIPTQDQYQINRFEDGMKPFGNGAGHPYKPLYSYKRKGGSPIHDGGENVDVPAESSPLGRWPANLILTEESAKNMGDESRFFYNVSTKLDESDPVYYCGKVSPKERNAGLDDLEDKEFGNMMHNANNTGKVSKGFERFGASVVKNNHPTLKPIDLMRYLATLLLPPIEYAPRRIFIPFSGVASEMIGAGLAGWEHIVGVENDTENGYVDIAEKRLEHWLS